MGNLCGGLCKSDMQKQFDTTSNQTLVVVKAPVSVQEEAVKSATPADGEKQIAGALAPAEIRKKVSQQKQRVACLPFYSVNTGLFDRLVRHKSRRLTEKSHRTINFNDFKEAF